MIARCAELLRHAASFKHHKGRLCAQQQMLEAVEALAQCTNNEKHRSIA
jgi:hypothetical protein